MSVIYLIKAMIRKTLTIDDRQSSAINGKNFCKGWGESPFESQ